MGNGVRRPLSPVSLRIYTIFSINQMATAIYAFKLYYTSKCPSEVETEAQRGKNSVVFFPPLQRKRNIN